MKEPYKQKLEELASKIPWSEVPDEIEPSPQPEEWESRFEDKIEELKKEAGEIPENTCPNVDKLIKEHDIVWKELAYLDKNAHRYESAEELVKDFPSRGWANTVEDIAEQLRKDNEQLRNLGKFWYEEYKDVKDFIKTEIRKAEEKAYSRGREEIMGSYENEFYVYNKAITDAVEALPKNVEYGPYEREMRDAVNETISEIRASLEALKK